MRKYLILAVVAIVVLSLGAAFVLVQSNSRDEQGSEDISSRKIKVVATNTIVADAVKQVGGERIEMESLMGVGVDPHIYKPTAGDIDKLEEADIIFYSGLELEARMADTLVMMTREGKQTYSLGEGINKDELIEPEEFEGKYDPHVWNDPLLWKQTIKIIEDGFSEIDPDNKETYQTNAEEYRKQIDEAYEYGLQRIEEIPEESRVLLTAHDAFGYFAIRYDFEVRSVQGTNTEAEASPQVIKELSDFVVEREIKAIFVENIVPGGTIESVQESVKDKGHEVEIGGELYSDSLGEDGGEADTYPKMHRANIDIIVDALK
jgi:manganese/zinc/iron transport system substrate-binding protein